LVSRKKLFYILVIFGAFTLSGCGAGDPNASSVATQEFGTDSDGSTSMDVADNGWTATEGDDGSGYTVTCNFSGDEANGDLVSCDVYWDAQNTSNIPLDYYGYSYLVVDNAIYQTSSGYAESRTINPGSYAVKKGGYNSFSVPYGGYITGLFKAEGPNEPHLLDLPLNIHIVNE
jgi:hypothetical protein